MALQGLTAAFEQFLASSVDGDTEQFPDVVTFVVGGRKFQVLEQTIRSRGQTMLTDLLCDPGRTDKAAPIYVEGDSERFRYILDWYRFGSMKIPCTVSMAEMRRECLFYGLPDDVQVEQEGVGAMMPSIFAVKVKAAEECKNAGAIAAAHAAFAMLLNDNSLWNNGRAAKSWNRNQQPPATDWHSCLVWCALFFKSFATGNPNEEYGLFKDTLVTLAKREEFSVDIAGNGQSMTISLTPNVPSGPKDVKAS